MKFHQLRCPNCQADLSLQEEKVKSQIVYCPYCGTKMIFDDEVKRYEYTHNINIKKETHFFDETKIYNSLAKKAKYDADAEQSKSDAQLFKYAMLVVIVLFSLLFIMSGIEDGYFDGLMPNITSAFDKQATISVPFNSSEIENSTTNYTHYIKELSDAGFTNIKTHENPDIYGELLAKEQMMKSP